ncbi:conjugal transfer protein TraG, partial [Chryseobacterium sp. 2TAF14]
QLDSLIPASKISTLTQGFFVGAVSDNFDERIEQKIFHSEIVVDSAKLNAQEKLYKKIPEIRSFLDEAGSDCMKTEIDTNYKNIKSNIVSIISKEMDRISHDPDLQHLLTKK